MELDNMNVTAHKSSDTVDTNLIKQLLLEHKVADLTALYLFYKELAKENDLMKNIPDPTYKLLETIEARALQ